MSKLSKVIAGLEQCYYGKCTRCPYVFSGDMSCHDALDRDALDVIEALRVERDDLRVDIETLTRINEDWRDEVARLHREITKALDLGAKLSDVAAGSQAPGSNYQKILRMGPWEMAAWILGTATVCDCCDRRGSCGIPEEEVTDVYCLEHIMRWLSKEAEV